MFRRILFCIPPFPGGYGKPLHPHTGIGYLSEILNANNIENMVIDLRLNSSFKQVQNKIQYFKPDLIGVTIMTQGHGVAYNLIKRLKTLGQTVVIGGPHVSVSGEKVLQECPADFAVMNEGEYTMIDLCNKDNLETIQGLIYRNGMKIISNPLRSQIKNLDNLPFPRFRKFQLEQYARQRIPIISSRGCPFNCTFCGIKSIIGNNYRMRSSENVIEEIKYWYNRGFLELDFQDDNFTVNKKRVHEICDALEHFEPNGYTNLVLMCGNGIRADSVDKKLLSHMYRVGFKSVAIGVESANSEVLRNIRKGEDILKIKNAIKMACDIGFDVTLFFIVGLPGETFESWKESMKLAYEFPISSVSFGNLIPYPKTELIRWVEMNNFFVRPPKEYLNNIGHLGSEIEPVFETPEFTFKERKLALTMAYNVSQDIRRRSMTRRLGNSQLASIVSYFFCSSLMEQIMLNVISNIPSLNKFVTNIYYQKRQQTKMNKDIR